MAPIRVGLIGLSTSDLESTALGNWGVISHMKPLLSSPHYELAAVCNSSVESASRSIEHHKLPATTKAYGSPEDLANDPDIDLVVVSVNVAKHFDLTKPALLRNKNVFVEWPLGASLKEAKELSETATAKGLRTAVGLQMRNDPMITKTKELIESGAIGRITSSVAWGCSSALPADIWAQEASYYLEMKSGGNEFYIFFGHFLDAFMFVLGEFGSVQSILKTQHPTLTLLNGSTGEVVDPAYKKAAPDHMFVQGVLKSDAVASLSLRKAKKPVDALGLRWLITGTDGEIELTMPEDHLQMGHKDRCLRLRQGKEGQTEIVAFENASEPAHSKNVPYPGTNTARMYEAFANQSGGYADFASSLKTHELLDKIARDAKYI